MRPGGQGFRWERERERQAQCKPHKGSGGAARRQRNAHYLEDSTHHTGRRHCEEHLRGQGRADHEKTYKDENALLASPLSGEEGTGGKFWAYLQLFQRFPGSSERPRLGEINWPQTQVWGSNIPLHNVLSALKAACLRARDLMSGERWTQCLMTWAEPELRRRPSQLTAWQVLTQHSRIT